MEVTSGFESTYIFGTGKDILELTKHIKFYEQDLELAKATGLRKLRYPAPWHRIERQRGVYDWGWMDQVMACLQRLNIEPILDPLHLTSFPEWLDGGFANPQFVRLYVEFLTTLATRYPWVTHYTVINEPFVTSWLCGHEGVWYPYFRGDGAFVAMVLNVGRAICEASRALVDRIPDVTLIHVDASEKHRAIDAESQGHERFSNGMRFLIQDLVLGRITDTHPLHPYLTKHGMADQHFHWFQQHPARIDVLGLDYYAHCELEWSREGRVWPNRSPEGFAAIALEYAKRYRLPVMLSETNIRGHHTDRISWMKFMAEQCELLIARLAPLNIPFEGFCWFPLIDSTDWDTILREANGRVDPQGIYWLDKRRVARHASELSEIFTALARGTITSKDIPAYRYRPPVDKILEGFLPLMQHWQWKEPTKLRLRQTKDRMRVRAAA